MTVDKQLNFNFEDDEIKGSPKGERLEDVLDEYGGTFKDSLKAPVHRWFRYPAGFSSTFVHQILTHFDITQPDQKVLDPFAGSGTTLVCAKEIGVRSTGVEAHPLVYRIGATKLRWDVDFDHIESIGREALAVVKQELLNADQADVSGYPELIHKCFKINILRELHVVREVIKRYKDDEALYGLLEVALLVTLRLVSHVGTAQWQYILPNKTKKNERQVYPTFKDQLTMMLQDLAQVKTSRVESDLRLGDARDLSYLEDSSIDLAFTSPPYLNNFDYADSTRLELYFLGDATSWGDITRTVRDRLMTSTVTQISRSKRLKEEIFDPNICKEVLEGLQDRFARLGEERLTHKGKKDYDLVMAGYFNDMYQMLCEVYRVLKPNSHFVLVMGDSAPYGVHIPALDYLGKMACDPGVGFKSYRIIQMRERNNKWRNRKHDVPLMEGLLVLDK